MRIACKTLAFYIINCQHCAQCYSSVHLVCTWNCLIFLCGEQVNRCTALLRNLQKRSSSDAQRVAGALGNYRGTCCSPVHLFTCSNRQLLQPKVTPNATGTHVFHGTREIGRMSEKMKSVSFAAQLRAATAVTTLAKGLSYASSTGMSPGDPWTQALSKVRGHTFANVTKVSTRQIFQMLNIPPADKSRASRKIAEGMRALGWSPAFVGPRNMRERGYIRRDHEIAPDEAAHLSDQHEGRGGAS